MSERASKILTWLQQQNTHELPIRQQTLADLFGCSRRSIGRALKELKEAGLLVDLNKRHENRCKLYRIVGLENWIATSDTPPRNDVLTPQAQLQWDKFEKTFRILLKMPELPTLYAQVTAGLTVTKEEELWSQTWKGLWTITGDPMAQYYP